MAGKPGRLRPNSRIYLEAINGDAVTSTLVPLESDDGQYFYLINRYRHARGHHDGE
jgi:hypothetical protein